VTKPIIKVDLSQAKAMILSVLPANSDRARILKGLGAAAVATWKRLALEQLRSSSRDYVAGISAPVYSKDTVEITLEGRMPNMVEQGWSGGDMRKWLLTSPKAKKGKNGPYMVVPFRHGAPGTGGRNVGTPMPDAIHAVAKRLAPTISRPGHAISGQGGATTVWGQRLHPGMKMKQEARQILGRLERPWHSTSIYMGMVRKAQPLRTGKYQTSGFNTFRTISMHTNEPGKHWVHPGITARNLGAKVQTKMVGLAHQIIGSATGTGK